MTQEPRKPINLSVHETVDPSVFSPDTNAESYGELDELKDSNHDDENVDVQNPGLADGTNDESLGDRQIGIANLSAG